MSCQELCEIQIQWCLDWHSPSHTSEKNVKVYFVCNCILTYARVSSFPTVCVILDNVDLLELRAEFVCLTFLSQEDGTELDKPPDCD